MRNTTIALLALSLLSSPAVADRLITVSAGANRATIDLPPVPAAPPIYVSQTTTFGRDYSDTGARLAVHVDVLPLISFEAGWADLGSTTGTISAQRITGEIDTTTVTIGGDAYWLAYTPGIRFDNVELHGKFGGARTDMKTFGFSAGSTELLVGAGVALHFETGFGLRLDAERLGDDITQFGISLTYGF